MILVAVDSFQVVGSELKLFDNGKLVASFRAVE